MPRISHVGLTLTRVLCVLCLILLTAKGQTLSIRSDRPSSATLGEGFRFICTVTGVTDLTGILSFAKGSASVCTVNTENCLNAEFDEGYSCACVNGQTQDFYLNISSVRRTDSANTWVCQYNDSVSNNGSLDVQYRPTITSVPSNKNVTETTSPNINCSSNIIPGNPSSTSYMWTGPDGYTKSGAILDRTVTRTQGGQYTCTATNKAGLSDTAQVNINVQYPPTITSVPNNKYVTENTSPNMDCSSNITPGNPSSTSYMWRGPDGYNKSGAILDRPVTRTQGGQYTCTANNTAGLSDTAQVNINVQYPPTITSVPNNKDVTENTSPNMDCSSNITLGNPSPTSYMWRGPGGYSKTGAVLDRPVTRTQGGQYTCTATNTAGLSDRSVVNINVQYGPVIISVPRNINITEKKNVSLDCSSNIKPGNPSSTSYRWTGPDGYSKNGSVLDRTITRTQGGQYNCTATNTAGLSDTVYVNINVYYAPVITSVPSNKDVTENTSPNIDCSSNITQGNPSSTSYRWTDPNGYSKAGAVLDKAVTRTMAGQYTCIAMNILGLSDSAQVNLSVIFSREGVSDNNSGGVTGLGISLGMCLFIIAGLIIGGIYFFRRKNNKMKKYKDALERNTVQTNVQTGSGVLERNTVQRNVKTGAVSEPSSAGSPYSNLHYETSRRAQYERINMIGKGGSTDLSKDYENMERRKSHIYQNHNVPEPVDIDANPYENQL